MGSGASTITTTTTKVDRIRVDDNGDIWKIKKNGQEKLCRPTSSKSNFGIIGKHFRNSTSAVSFQLKLFNQFLGYFRRRQIQNKKMIEVNHQIHNWKKLKPRKKKLRLI